MALSAFGSVSQLIHQAKAGDENALGELHQRYWPQLVALARRKLRNAPELPQADEEDVAQSAFIGFYRTVKAQRIPQLQNRHQLLALLTHIVACKALNEIKHAMTQKRGGGQVLQLSPLAVLAEDEQYTPLQEAILNDCYSCYVETLPDSLRTIAEMHLAGMTNREIAEECECVERTVERKIALLRQKWQALTLADIPDESNSGRADPESSSADELT